jgi:outer membrane protein assembly factor BamE (lipoprotein component of BamABCDE complex)
MRRFMLIAALSVASCAATGTQVKPEQLAQFERGKTTYQDVVAAIGKPNNTTITADGNRTAMYIYAESSMRAATFIPYIGPFVGGMDTRSNMVMMMFDRQGVLQNYSASEGASGTGMGFASGVSATPVPSQPKQAPVQ